MDEFISREETIKRIKEVYCVGCNSYNGVRCRACGTGDAIDMFEDAPAADVAPVRHGRWELTGADKYGRGGIWKCTGRDGCGKFYPYKCDFCPNCGAKMDGGAE